MMLQETEPRPGEEEYFMGIAKSVAKRSTCLRHKIGAVLTREKQILTTGYNGAPSGVKHCTERGCIRNELNIKSGEQIEKCWAVHAEANAIIQAALHGVSTKDSILYCTHKPCASCTKMIINAGIRQIIYEAGYDDALSDSILNEAAIKIARLKA